mgnify:CR=1 FL=1
MLRICIVRCPKSMDWNVHAFESQDAPLDVHRLLSFREISVVYVFEAVRSDLMGRPENFADKSLIPQGRGGHNWEGEPCVILLRDLKNILE